jgi:hypothetical protein
MLESLDPLLIAAIVALWVDSRVTQRRLEREKAELWEIVKAQLEVNETAVTAAVSPPSKARSSRSSVEAAVRRRRPKKLPPSSGG